MDLSGFRHKLKQRGFDGRWTKKIREHSSTQVLPNPRGGGGYIYCPKGKKRRYLRGLTTWMSEALLRKVGQPRSLPKQARAPTPGPLQLTGAERGSLVHRQLEHAVNQGHLDRDPDPYTTSMLHAMVQVYKWQMIRSEFLVHSLPHNVGFKVDLLACDRKGRMIVGEVKTSYVGGAFDFNSSGCAWRLACLRDAGIPCTPFGLATVQVVLGAALIARRWRFPVKRMRLYVVRVDHTGVEFSRIHHTIYHQIAAPLLAHMLTTAGARRRRQAAIRRR